MDWLSGGDQVAFDPSIDRSHLLGNGLPSVDNRIVRHRPTIQVDQDFAGPFQRYEMVVVEVNRLAFEDRPILHRLAHLDRKVSSVHLLTPPDTL